MSIPKYAQKVGAIVVVNAGDDVFPDWVTGVIEEISLRPSGSYGALMKVDTRPHDTRQINRYADAGRIILATEEECREFALARTKSGLYGQVKKGDCLNGATASLTTQIPAGDTSMVEAPRTNHEQVQTVALRVTKGGDFVALKQLQLDAIFGHPQVVEVVNGLFKDGADQIVGKHQALEFKATALERANRSISEDLELARTSLKSCDTERRALMQKEAQRAGEIARLKDDNRILTQRLNMRDATAAVRDTEDSVLVKAGKERGFVLWCPTSAQAPRVKYPTLAEAKKVQESMAASYKGQVFHILPVGPGLMYKVPVKAERVSC